MKTRFYFSGKKTTQKALPFVAPVTRFLSRRAFTPSPLRRPAVALDRGATWPFPQKGRQPPRMPIGNNRKSRTHECPGTERTRRLQRISGWCLNDLIFSACAPCPLWPAMPSGL